MDWAGWALFGVIATSTLTALMITAQLAGLTRLDLPLVLGSLVTADPDRARVAGFFVHLTVGQGFAVGYAATFRPGERRQCTATCLKVPLRVLLCYRPPSGAGAPRTLRASRIICWVKPHSLSYQAMTLTSVPSTTVVSSRSMMAARGSPTMSADTSGSSETPRMPS